MSVNFPYYCILFPSLPSQSKKAPSIFFRRRKEMKMSGTGRIKEMLLSRLCAVYAVVEKMRAAQKLPKCFHASSATKDIIETVWKAGGSIEIFSTGAHGSVRLAAVVRYAGGLVILISWCSVKGVMVSITVTVSNHHTRWTFLHHNPFGIDCICFYLSSLNTGCDIAECYPWTIFMSKTYKVSQLWIWCAR